MNSGFTTQCSTMFLRTETQGRVHTSTATVLVMPEMEEVECTN